MVCTRIYCGHVWSVLCSTLHVVVIYLYICQTGISVVITDLSLECHLFVLVPRVCDACKETDENDNEIVDNLCKNDFGKSIHTSLSICKGQEEKYHCWIFYALHRNHVYCDQDYALPCLPPLPHI